MPDPYLEAMMRGEFAKKATDSPRVPKDKFEIAIEKHLNAYIDSLNLENEFGRNSLVTPAIKRAQIKQELKQRPLLKELNQNIELAFNTLAEEAKHYIEAEEHEQLLTEFGAIEEKIEDLDLNASLEEDFQKILGISDETMEAMIKVATAQFSEEKYGNALAIFILLATFNPGEAVYWYRIGMIAQQMENLDLALRAYGTAITCDEELVGARLFSVECHLINKNKAEAETEYQEAKKILDAIPSSDVQPEWLELFAKISEALKE